MELLDSVQSPDVVLDVTGLHLECRGRAAVRAFLDELYDSIPDFGMAESGLTATGDSAAVQWDAWGTFTGKPFQGIVATGRPVNLRGVVWCTAADGLIREHIVYYDGADFGRQVGLLPPLHGRAERAMFAAFNTGTRLRHALRLG